jgi:transglutaminase-like putative cysteine protease
MKVFTWRGVPPALISLTGKVAAKKEVLRSAEVEALDSISGWSSLTDEQGNFMLRDLTWYPRASYTVVIKPNDRQARQVKVIAPAIYPEGGTLNIGELGFDQGCVIDATELPGENSVSYIKNDMRDLAYYRELFNELTEGKQTDEEKLDAISRFVASKLILDEKIEPRAYLKPESPRHILEEGSRYCGELALALATIAEAGNYKARMLDLIDAASQPSSHMVTEVYYAERWHLYDPIIGAAVRVKEKRTVSYKEVRLDTDFKFQEAIPEHLPQIPDHQKNRMANLYASGFHHYYYLR